MAVSYQAGWSALTARDLEAIAEGRARLVLGAGSVQRMGVSRETVESLMHRGQVVYGVNTGFGNLVSERIPDAALRDLQRNLLRSHACGVGETLTDPESRAMVALRAHSLAFGHSGVRPQLVRALLALLAKNVVPVIPLRGSVGASGDLAPLAHLALVLIGEGRARVGARRSEVGGAVALRRAGLRPVVLAPKEGLALINGTQLMAGVGSLSWCRAERVLLAAELAAAMSVEALLGSVKPFDERFARVRPHPGHAETAARLRSMLRGSGIVASHRNCGRVQDAYTERCVPQVLGSVRDSLRYVRRCLEIEINSVSDNPLVFGGEVISGGNFHGQPVATALDVATIALAQVAGFSERRTFRMLDAKLGELPAFLARRPGLESGLMLVQYTAAALVAELKVLSHPASVDTIPTSASTEDHVSMGSVAATKLRQAVPLAARVVAAELVAAAEAQDRRRPLRPAAATGNGRDAVRRYVPPLTGDRPLGGQLDVLAEAILDGSFPALPDPRKAGVS
ncbi:MAG: histidine ammonia-lyase [Candidatus Eisenbacteria bacterium]|nr:histidine ammonia-lyase [Candidatus Eisenbacteria bacterium]